MLNVSTKKTNTIVIKKINTIATNVTSTASINYHSKKVQDCYILHTVLLVQTCHSMAIDRSRSLSIAWNNDMVILLSIAQMRIGELFSFSYFSVVYCVITVFNYSADVFKLDHFDLGNILRDKITRKYFDLWHNIPVTVQVNMFWKTIKLLQMSQLLQLLQLWCYCFYN